MLLYDLFLRFALVRVWKSMRLALACCLLAGLAHAATEQTPAASASPDGSGQVVLGASTLQLTGPWKFHTGDDRAWADPGYNDSRWEDMDLTPQSGVKDPFLGVSGFVPGWTVRGHSAYSGFAWYRLRVNLQAMGDGKGNLALMMPDNLDDAYQVFVDGKLIGEFGKFTAKGVTSYLTLPRVFHLPASPGSGPVTIAVRVWMNPSTPLINADTGGMHSPPVLGLAGPVQALLRLDWSLVDHSQLSRFLEAGILLLAMTVVMVLFLLDRRERSYVWLELTLLAALVQAVVTIVTNYTTWIPATPALLLLDAFLRPIQIGLWVMFWASWFRLGHMGRLRWMVFSMTAMLCLSVALLREPLYGHVVPANADLWLMPVSLLMKLLLGSLLVWVAWEGTKRDMTGGWLGLTAVVLVFVALYQQDLQLLHVAMNYFPFGYQVGIAQIAVVLSLNIITMLLMRRFLKSQQQREHLQIEIQQAREVQQVLIPDAIPTIPGFRLESEYRPALQVGGDFFQILPDDAGGVLIVLGDVTGKGLQAGMLVALIVGAIRAIVETSYEPVFVLEALNRQLCGRSQAYATCVALHVDVNGETTIANAGHLAPYLNRKEIAMEGNLPLGMTEHVQFEQMKLTLQPGDRITVLTDGVVEAKSPNGDLFGFNHARAISHLPASFIARSAQIFGQDDDITVLAISREAEGDKQAEALRLSTQAAEA